MSETIIDLTEKSVKKIVPNPQGTIGVYDF